MQNLAYLSELVQKNTLIGFCEFKVIYQKKVFINNRIINFDKLIYVYDKDE